MGEIIDMNKHREKKGKNDPKNKSKKCPYYMPLEELIRFASKGNKKNSK